MNLRKIFWRVLPPFLWICIIYFASSQPYEKQDLRPILWEWDLSWVDAWFSWVSFTYSQSVISIETRGTAAFVEFFIRKGAHLFVFAVLGFFIFRLIKLFNIKSKMQFIISLTIIVVVASIDEYRHFLHPNRTGLVEDVILDTVGGLIGITIGLLMRGLIPTPLKRKSI